MVTMSLSKFATMLALASTMVLAPTGAFGEGPEAPAKKAMARRQVRVYVIDPKLPARVDTNIQRQFLSEVADAISRLEDVHITVADREVSVHHELPFRQPPPGTEPVYYTQSVCPFSR